MGRKRKGIDNVTTSRLDMTLRMSDIFIDIVTLDKIIDVVELIEKKGGKTSLNDVCHLKQKWREHYGEEC